MASDPPAEAIAALFPELAGDLAGTIWERNGVGMSASAVYRLTSPDGAVHHLKVAPRDAQGGELEAEAARLRWVRGHLPVPQVLRLAIGPEYVALLLSAIPGVMAFDACLHDDIPGLITTLAEGLCAIHALPVADCPFDERLAAKLPRAQARVEHGMVTIDELDEDHRQSPAALLALLRATPAPPEDLVFTHGDYCLPNILIDPQTRQITGFIDWSRAGIADRYQDLAIAARTIAHNLGPQWSQPFLAAYGLAKPDEAKLEYYRLLDEFF